MPVDYSKWDALELSDDSDIEVHPNVDKRSFIRAKQNQIHQQRFERKHRITTLKYERVVNDGLLRRIDALLKRLDGHKKKVESIKENDEVDGVVFEALMEMSQDSSLGPDLPETPPDGVHSKESELSYSRMMSALVDQTKEEVDKSVSIQGLKRYEAYVTEVKGHEAKVQKLQIDLAAELARLEKEESGKITSESIHTGFDRSSVSKNASTAGSAVPAKTSKQPELLNPSAVTTGSEADISSGAVADDDDEVDMEASPTAKMFGKIPFGDYHTSLNFIGKHPEILNEKETDGLLVEAFNAQSNAKTQKHEDYARQCVHQALLLQYCRQLGKDGVGLFFKRVQTPNHQARKLFLDDVNSTFARIKSRTAELNKQKAEDEAAGGSGDREQIQLHAVDPNTQINIVTPPPLDQCQNEDEKASRQIFETFSPGLRRALESGSLDKVNEVLGKMSVEEAEQTVEQLGNGGMLSLEEGVIDATTEEGQMAMEEIERNGRMPGQDGQQQRKVETSDDPGMD
nr:hsp90 co-chaperone cdc37 [Quercus suber]